MLGINCWFEYTIVQKIAIKRFAPGPAKATHSIFFLGFRKLEKLTGTGFAQPININPEVNANIGITILPIKSICLMGLRVNLPCLKAVLSPNLWAKNA